MEYEIHYIPEYDPEDTLINRLVALVRLEQSTDERSMTVEILQDLMIIALDAWKKNETRIHNIASLILNHSLKYIEKERVVEMKIPLEEFELLKKLKQQAESIDCSSESPRSFLTKICNINKKNHHFLIKIYIQRLISSYHKNGNFSGVFTFCKNTPFTHPKSKAQ